MEINQNAQLPPLQNSLILEMIFQDASYNNLEIYRQVCKQWYISSLKRWKAVSKVRISGIKDKNALETYLKLTKNKNRIKTDKSRATHYILEDLILNHSSFWQSNGPSIKFLQMSNCKFESADSFRHAIFKSCPDLEHLKLDNVTVQNESPVAEPTEWEEPQFGENWKLKSLTIFEAKKRGISWMELLSHFPAIEALEATKESIQYQKIFQTIKIIRQQDSNKLQLKHLHNPVIAWPGDGDGGLRRPDSLDVLLDSNLSLETLSVMVMGFRGTESFLEVLDLHRETLKELSLRGNVYTNEGPFMHVPVLPNRPLEKLETLTISTHEFPSMAFLKFTPVLRRLVLKQEYSRKSDCLTTTKSTDLNGFTLPTCTELEITQDGIIAPNLEKLMDWLPNVETLKMNGTDNKIFSLICKRWPGLVSLSITESKVNDLGLSGFERRNDIPGLSKKSKKSGDPNNSSMQNVTDLKNLKYLSLNATEKLSKSKGKRGEVVMGYHAAAYAIGKLASLKKLQIQNYKLADEALWRELLAKYSP